MKRLSWARLLLLLFAVALIAVGLFNGDANDVMQKATRICLECVGIG